MIHRIDVQVTTPLHATEVGERVEAAVTTLFPAAEVEERHGEVVAETHSLERLRERLREQNIVDAAREVFLGSLEGETFAFDLKKQAALEGVVTFAVGSPDELGSLHVRVRVEEPSPEAFIDYLAPQSGDGA